MTTCTNCDHPAADHLGREFGGGCAPHLESRVHKIDGVNVKRIPRCGSCKCPGWETA